MCPRTWKKGYAIELLGFGKLYLRFVNGKSVSAEKDATAALVKALVPGFRPSFTMVNNSRIYDLIPDKISLVKYTGTTVPAGEDDTSGGEGRPGRRRRGRQSAVKSLHLHSHSLLTSNLLST